MPFQCDDCRHQRQDDSTGDLPGEVNGEPVHAWQLDEVFAIVMAQVQAQGIPITPQAEPELRKVASCAARSARTLSMKACHRGDSVSAGGRGQM